MHHTLTVTNPADAAEELQFGIGYHPAFQVPFDDSHTVEDYEFRFDQPESPVILDASGGGLLTGKCYYQWKNQQAIQLTNDLFDNDSFCMAGLRIGKKFGTKLSGKASVLGGIILIGIGLESFISGGCF